MNIHLVTPAKKNSKNGNRTTALRWSRLLQNQGHKVRISTDYKGEQTDLVIALHAWRSADAIQLYRDKYPDQPLVVALGGTDVNTFLKTDPQPTLKSMHMADALVCLHDLIAVELPSELRGKLTVIRQSARPLPRARKPSSRYFDVCVVGHLREEKDPFRTAKAARLLAPDSKIRVMHYGKAHNPEWAEQAINEMDENPRYIWKGEVAAWQVRRAFSHSRLMVISSVQEGGANVVSEALVADVPIIASDIAGNVGLLREDFPGYYPVGDEQALAGLLNRAEQDSSFIDALESYGRKLAPMFKPETESTAWKNLLRSIT